MDRSKVHVIAGGGRAYNPRLDDPAHFPVRFLVSSDPFSRLVSSYLDKAYLPDFWSTEIAELLRKSGLRGQHVDARQVRLGKDFLRQDLENIHRQFGNETSATRDLRGTVEDQRCGKYATFREFIESSLSR